MAATTSLPSLCRKFNLTCGFKTLKPTTLFLKPASIRASKEKTQIRFELRSFENTQKLSLGSTSVSETARLHIMQSSSVSMTTNAAELDSSAKNSKRVCLFYFAEMKELAERIAAESDAIELRNITWRTFDDGFPNLFISNAHGIRGQHVAFLASFSSPGVIFEQLSVICALPKLFVSSFTLVLPFFPTGTFERMEEEGDVATAFTLARILSNIPNSRGGPTSLVIFDIHALQERFYFGDNILPCFESGVPLLKNRLQQLPDSDNVYGEGLTGVENLKNMEIGCVPIKISGNNMQHPCKFPIQDYVESYNRQFYSAMGNVMISIAFPDDGAWKRFHKQLQHFPTIVCVKVREGNKRIVHLKEGDPRGRHVVIVDDLVQSGGTLIECQKMLAAHGAITISAYVTHGIFPNRSWERFQQGHNGSPENALTYFWITDSCPLTVKEVENKAPFEILSLAGSIATSLQI